MSKKSFNLGLVLSIILSISSFAQKQKDVVLFTVNGQKIYVSEFSRVYEKNLSLVNDPNQKDIDNYLNLYINYKLKLQEAYQLKMDTVGAYKREYAKYENQLIQPFLKDENLELDLINEAYERSKKEVNASHILVKIEKGEDTLVALKKINDIKERIAKGEDFAKLARELSNDPSAAKNGGNLGYFTAFQMVYPFENVAYKTKVGEISEPFKTQFGYHLVKVHDIRDSKGEVEVAHIMLKGDYDQNQPLIDNIKKQLNEGADFTELAKSYSQDGGTSKNGGLLPRFGSGRMIPSFETVAFSLQNEGDISEPFKTEFGWHIIKLIKKYPIGTFDEMKASLKQKVDQGQRAQFMGNSVAKRLMKEYQFDIKTDKLNAFSKPEWEKNASLQNKDLLMSIQGQKFSVNNFYTYFLKDKNVPYTKAFDLFKEEKVMEIYIAQLPEKNPELKETMKEYREGLLLFDLMQKKIWDKAEKDSLGLQVFFDVHRSNYKWGERAKMVVVTLKSQNGDAILEALKNQVENDSIWNLFKDVDLIDIRDEVQETSNDKFPTQLNKSVGSYTIVPVGNQFKLFYIKDILPIGNKELKEVRGRVMSDYQDQLEQDWVSALKKRFPVKINQKSLKKLKLKYKN
jgi:peptidyl-prolyl cis-trans isomerase SurA